MTITATQCAMARKCLRWPQEELAKSSNVGITTISNFEKLKGDVPRDSTLAQLRKTFEKHGIEFLEGDGVRRRLDQVRVYCNRVDCDNFFDSIQEETKNTNIGVLALIQSHDMLTQPCDTAHRSILARLELLHKTIQVKCLLSNSIFPSFEIPSFQIRQAHKTFDNPSSYMVYGNKYAIIHLNGRANFHITVFDIPTQADDFRSNFLSLWSDAVLLRVPPGSFGPPDKAHQYV